MGLTIPSLKTHGCAMLRAMFNFQTDRPNQSSNWQFIPIEDSILVFNLFIETQFAQLYMDYFTLEWVRINSWNVPIDNPARLEDLDALVDSLNGTKTLASISGSFLFVKKQLPFFIGVQSSLVPSGDLRLRATKGTYALQGSPIKDIEWSNIDDTNYSIEIRGEFEGLTIDDKSLTSALNFLNPIKEILANN